MTRVVSWVLAVFLILAGGLPAPPPARAAGRTRLYGTLRYSEHGPAAATEGVLAGILWGSAIAPVASARMLKGLSVLGALSSTFSTSSLMNAINETVPANLAAMLPLHARYQASVSFTLEETSAGVFELVSGTVRWALQSEGEIGDENTTISDRYSGEGSQPLRPGDDRIQLRVDLSGDEPAFDLEMDIEHAVPVSGLSRWSALAGLVVLEWRASGGKVTFGGQSFGEPIPEELVQSEATTRSLYYHHRGRMEDLTYLETWRDPADSQVVVSYRIADACTTEVLWPEDQDRWTVRDAGDRLLEHHLEAETVPEIWADALLWELGRFGELEPEYEPDPPKGGEVRVRYLGAMPEENSAFGALEVRPTYKGAVPECEDPEPREVRVFFPRDAQNNPAGDVPNWFYYWLDTAAAQGHKGAIRYDAGEADYGAFRGFENPWLADRIYVGNLFSGGSGGTNPITGRYFEGIDLFGAVVRHEWTHLETYADWWGEAGMDSARDLDRDYIPDDREKALGLRPGCFDSLGYGYRDAEYPAYQAEDTWPTGAANREDWADPGKQSQG